MNLDSFNKTLFDITSKLDKCLFLVIGCGFNLNDLLTEPKGNFYVKVMGLLIEKMKMFITLIETLSESRINNYEYFYQLFEA